MADEQSQRRDSQQTMTASGGREPGRCYDANGVLIGPWSDSVKRANRLLRETWQTRRRTAR